MKILDWITANDVKPPRKSTRDIIVNQDVRSDTDCWACSRSPVTIQGKTCSAEGCERTATNALGYYWNPSPGLGGRKINYLCSTHGIELATKLYAGDRIALLT